MQPADLPGKPDQVLLAQSAQLPGVSASRQGMKNEKEPRQDAKQPDDAEAGADAQNTAAGGAGDPIVLAQADAASSAAAAGKGAGSPVEGGASAASTAGASGAFSLTSGLGLFGALGVTAALVASGSGSKRSAAEPDSNTPAVLAGSVIDGYIEGAMVFVDLDGDGERDEGEPGGLTGADGKFSFQSTSQGVLVAKGGVDTSTQLPFVGALKAPAGATVITPLTTLVAELMQSDPRLAAAQSQQIVLAALGAEEVAGRVNLLQYDPLAQQAGDATAFAVQVAGVTVATLVSRLTSQLQYATGAADALQDDLAREVFTRLTADLEPGSLTRVKIADTAANLLDTLSALGEVGGVTLDDAQRARLQEGKTFIVDTISDFVSDLEGIQQIGEIGALQKEALERPETYTLQLLHFADAESGMLASQTASRLAALVDAFEGQATNSITLAGGDNFLPGPFLAAGTDASLLPILGVPGNRGNVEIGAVDIALHNLIGVQASAIGNHEFDLGSSVLAAAFRPGAGSPGANFPYLSANLDFSADAVLAPHFRDTVATSGLEEASSLKGLVAPSAVITEGGARIGLVGATTQLLESISSPSGTRVKDNDAVRTDDMDLLAAQLQPVIDDLVNQGVNKVILMAHLQVLSNEKLLASKLSGVDIILAAGSNTRLGDAGDTAVQFPGHAATFADTYPLVVKDKDGRDTLVVNTDNEFTYLGRLIVDFDANGHIVVGSLASNAALNGAYAATDANVAAAWGTSVDQLATTAYAEGTRGAQVKALTDAVQSVITAKDGVVYGYADVYLEGERIAVRNQETNLGNLSADANAYALQRALGDMAAQTYIVSLKNGGGIRAQIGTLSAPDPVNGTVDKLPPDGGVSQLDVENSLRFNNQLMAFDTTTEGLKAILEHSVAALGSQGRFPQLGGVSFSFDPDLPAGSRVGDVALIGEGYRVNLYNDGVKLADAPAQITVVTLNFLANGGDSYPIKANGSNFRYLVEQPDGSLALTGPVDESLNFTAADTIAAAVGSSTLLGEQAALAEYMQAFHATPESAYRQPDTAAELDTRIQNLNVRSEDVLGTFLLNGTIDGLGDAITLYFDRSLDTVNLPDVSQFTLVGQPGAAAIEVTGLQVFNNQVRLLLASPLEDGATVRVAFRDPALGDDTHTLQARDGTDVSDFQGLEVTNRLSQQASGTANFSLASTVTLAGAEISTFDPVSQRLFVTSSTGLQVLSVDSDLKLTLLGTVSLGSNDINSVAASNGLVAVAVAAADKTQPGSVYFINAGASLSAADGVIAHDGFVQGSVTVGALPDMLVFTADGTRLLVANEAEQDASGNNPEGSVSIIDLVPMLAGGAMPAVTTASFGAFNDKLAELKAAGVRLFAGETGFEGITVAQDLEPEYIAISPDGKTAFVTLQENNAIGILDIALGEFTDIVPLGLKSFLGLPFDGSDRDGPDGSAAVALSAQRPVFGQYMPDAIASYTGADGKAYFVIANEGDDRDDFINPDETARVSSPSYVLDPTAFVDAVQLKANTGIGRLTVSNLPGNRGDIDSDGDIDQILTYGARSFSIADADGRIVFDSGSHVEQFVAAGGIFDANNPAGSGLFDDTRSDNKGPEPEGITIGHVGDKTLAFVGLERGGGGVMIYDVTDPARVSFVQYLRNPADVSPEGLSFVSAADSPNRADVLFVTNEVSNTLTAFTNRLDVGDLVFLGVNADAPDAFAFALLTSLSRGTQIGFSDRDYSEGNGFSGLTNEAAMIWTADRDYAAGTIVTIQPDAGSGINPLADKGSVQGEGGGLSTTAETLYAFLGSIADLGDGAAGEIVLDKLLASINVGGAAAGYVPASIAPTSISLMTDNARYNGSLDPDVLTGLATHPDSWIGSDVQAYALSNGAMVFGV